MGQGHNPFLFLWGVNIIRGILLSVSVVISSSLLLVAFAYFIFWFISDIYLYFEKTVKAKRNKCNVISSFDVSEYRKRREKLLLEIEQERQTEPKYHVTLWFGLRGLRERVGGNYEWIYRTPQNPTPEFTPKKNELSPAQLAVDRARAMARNADIPTFRPTGLANGNWSGNCSQQVNAETVESFRNWQTSQMVQSNQASIDDLRNRISNLQLQATQQELNQYVINSVCYPQYLKVNPACYVSTPCISAKTER